MANAIVTLIGRKNIVTVGAGAATAAASQAAASAALALDTLNAINDISDSTIITAAAAGTYADTASAIADPMLESGQYFYALSGTAPNKRSKLYLKSGGTAVEQTEIPTLPLLASVSGAALVGSNSGHTMQAAENAVQAANLTALKALPVSLGRATFGGSIWQLDDTANWSTAARTAGEGYMLAVSTANAAKIWVRQSLLGPQLSHWGVFHNANAINRVGTNVTTLVQAYLDYCVATRSDVIVHGRMELIISGPLYYDPTVNTERYKQPVFDMSNVIFYSNNSAATGTGGLFIGSPLRSYQPATCRTPAMMRSPLNWSGANGPLGDDSGVTIYNMLYCKEVTFGRIYGWTNGVVCHAENHGWGYNRILPSEQVSDCQNLYVLRTKRGTVVPGGEWLNENTFYSGVARYNSDSNTVSGTANPSGYAIRFCSFTADAYRGANANRFPMWTFELAAPAAATYRVPFYFDGCGSQNSATGGRVESFKGPLMICRNGGDHAAAASLNEISFDYCDGTVANGARQIVLEVAGAFANRLLGSRWAGDLVQIWQSGPLRDVVRSNGAADTFRIAAPFYTNAAGTSTPVATLGSGATQFRANANCLQIASGAGGALWLRFPVDNAYGGVFRTRAAIEGRNGRLSFRALDANGAVLPVTATDAVWGDEPYIKFGGAQTSAAFGGSIRQPGNDVPSVLMLSWRSEVKFIEVGVIGGSADAALLSCSFAVNFQYQNAATGVTTFAGSVAPIYPLPGDADNRAATANPFSAGTIGYYSRGMFVANANAAVGQPKGWYCTTAGWRARAWAINTAYAIPGHLVANGGNIYRLVTAGTSAGSGGPTGTTPGAIITDNTCEWTFVGAAAAGTADGNL